MTNLRDRPTRTIRLAYVTASFPYPLWSGYLRHHFLLRELAETHVTTLLSLVGESYEPKHRRGVVGLAGIHTFARRGGRLPRAMEAASSKQRASGAVGDLCAALDAMAGRGEIDAVLLSGKDTAAAASVAVDHDLPLVVDLCDATSSRLAQQTADARLVGRVTGRARRRRMQRIERGLIDVADAMLVASDRDRSALVDEHGPSKVLVDARTVPNGIDGSYWTRSTRSLGEDVAFCGNLGYPPNAVAAARLVRSIMPLVWRDQPDVGVRLIGRGARADLLRLGSDPRVTFSGSVPDVRPHLEAAAVFVAPLRAAAGIQNKVLEALAMEVPVVATTCAAAGLCIDGTPPPVQVHDDDESLAADIARALDARRDGATPDIDGGRWVREHFVWQRSAETVARTIADACARHRDPLVGSGVGPC